jgi:hypothetical protein
MSTSAATFTRFTVTRTTSLWRVTFNNPPINLIDPVMIVELHRLFDEVEQDKKVAVVLFDSADPDFFLAHYDLLADTSPFEALPSLANPFHHWTSFLIRLSKAPAVTINRSSPRPSSRASSSAPTSNSTSAPTSETPYPTQPPSPAARRHRPKPGSSGHAPPPAGPSREVPNSGKTRPHRPPSLT